MQRKCENWKLRVAGLLLVAAVGCGSGPTLTPVKGVVKVDGKPAKGVVLTFIKEGAGMDNIPATATSGDDGSFVLSSGERGGAEVGKYKVSASWPDFGTADGKPKISKGDESAFDAPDQLKGKYVFGKSTLTVEVKSGATELPPIELTQ